MNLQDHLTPEEFKELSDVMEKAEDLISKAMGKKCDLIAVSHQRHDDNEQCGGVAVLTCLGALETFTMLARASHEMGPKAKEEYFLRHVSVNELPV